MKTKLKNPILVIAKEVNFASGLFGFPLKVDATDGGVSFPKRAWAQVLLMFFLAHANQAATIVWHVLSEESLDEQFERFRQKSGIDASTMILAYLVVFMSNLSFIAAFFLVRAKVPRISSLCARMAEAADFGAGDGGPQVLGIATKRKLKTHVNLALVMSLAATATYFAFSFGIIMDFLLQSADSEDRRYLAWTMLGLSVWSFFLVFLNPHVNSISVLSVYLIGCLSECYDRMRHSLLSKQARLRPSSWTADEEDSQTGKWRVGRSGPSHREILFKGRLLDELLGDLNALLSPLILFLYVFYLSLVTAFSYMALVPVLMSSASGGLLVLAGYSFFLLALYLLGLYFLCVAGQTLEERRAAARTALEDWLAEDGEEEEDGDDKVLRKEAEILVQQLDRVGRAVTPYNAFGVNHSGFVGMVATIATYVVVLVQFKVADNSSSDNGCQVHDADTGAAAAAAANDTTTL